MRRLLVIGGSDAGISAALRAKELAPSTEVSVAVADQYPNFSICGLPFYLSGEVPDWHTLAHRTASDIEREGVRLLLGRTATSIDPIVKEVSVGGREEDAQKLTYDRLIIAAGAQSIRPKIDGIDLPGVFLLRWMEDAFAIMQYINERQPSICDYRWRRIYRNGNGRCAHLSGDGRNGRRICRIRTEHR